MIYLIIINTDHNSTARAVEHHIHEAEEVLDHTVALHYIHIPKVEATAGLGADILKEEEDPEDLVAIAGLLVEDTTDIVAEAAVQVVGLNSRNQDQ